MSSSRSKGRAALKVACRRFTEAVKRQNLRRIVFQREQAKGAVLCFVCQKEVTWGKATLEHIKPKCEGGSDLPTNLAISHHYCNSRRGNAK